MTEQDIKERYGMSQGRFLLVSYTMIAIFYNLIGLLEDLIGFSINCVFQFIIALIIASFIMARDAYDSPK